MTNEIISYRLKFLTKNNSQNPKELTVSKLVQNNIIKNESELLVSLEGELNTYFEFGTKQNIRITRHDLTLSALTYEDVVKYVLLIQEVFPESEIQKLEIKIDEHFKDKSYPNSVIEKFLHVEGLDLDVVRYKKNNISFTLFNCSYKQMHLLIELESQMTPEIKLGKLDVNNIIKLEEIMGLKQSFVRAYLK